MSLRYNVETVDAETGEESTRNWQTRIEAIDAVNRGREGDAIVINVVAGPVPGEL
jgi:TPP-dependent trihydroxycyclohexane-1,2-dione (THcHDO) dehydratase